jgi:hypothetical protein
MHSIVMASLLCGAAVIAEGVLAGPGVRERLRALNLPPFWLWVGLWLANRS